MGETTSDDYDEKHGKPGKDFTPPPAGQEWTVELNNPVRDTPAPFKNLTGGGSSGGSGGTFK